MLEGSITLTMFPENAEHNCTNIVGQQLFHNPCLLGQNPPDSIPLICDTAAPERGSDPLSGAPVWGPFLSAQEGTATHMLKTFPAGWPWLNYAPSDHTYTEQNVLKLASVCTSINTS